MNLRSLSAPSRFVAGLAVSAALALTGCGMGTSATPSTEPMTLSTVKGLVHGGPNPIVGATVKMYATQTVAPNGSTNNYGYGQSSLLLAEANTVAGQSTGYDTDSSGGFVFSAASYINACPAGQQVYIVVSGGNSGAGNNPNSLLMAALGSCSSLYDASGETWTGGNIWVNELTTIASAYALNNFIGVSGPVVNISAPAANNSITTGTTTAASGLSHAFTVAMNLVNTSTGAVNPTVGSSALPGIVPVALINTLGNVLQYCVNSQGGAAGDNSNCGNLFASTTIGTAVPADTLSSLLNLVRNPTTNVSTIYGYTAANGFYQPSLAASTNLSTWALAITFPGASGSLMYEPIYVALDANDEAYFANYSGVNATGANLNAINYDGSLGFQTAYIPTYYAPRVVAADSVGNIFVSCFSSPDILRYSQAGGSSQAPVLRATSYDPYGLAVDAANNIWFSEPGLYGIYETTFNNTTGAFSTTTTSRATTIKNGTTSVPTYSIIVDNDQNVWASTYSTTTGLTNESVLIPNTGTAAAPAYAYSSSTTTNYILTAGSGLGSYGITVDGSGTAYMAYEYSTTGIQPFAPNAATDASAVTAGTEVTGFTNPYYPTTDGDGSIWVGATTLAKYVPSTGTLTNYAPCYLATATATTCAATSSHPRLPRRPGR